MSYLDETGLSALWSKIKSYVATHGSGSALSAYPVGSIYISVNATNPGTIFGGTWEAWGTGRMPVGVDTSQTEFNDVEKTGGEKTHTLTISEMPKHRHDVLIHASSVFSSGTNKSGYISGTGKMSDYVGSGAAHNNLPPYITCHMWKRTA